MNAELSYCNDCEIVFGRLRKLYEQQAQDIICARMNVPLTALKKFALANEEGFCEYPDIYVRIKFWDAYLKERAVVKDDSVPSVQLKEMDQGLYGGLFGGDIRFLCDPTTGLISSMVYPLLQNLSEFESLVFTTDENKWYNRYIRQLKVFVEGSRGKFGISHLIAINGFNFLFELVGGTKAYIAAEETPELVKKSFTLAYQVNMSVQNTFFEQAPLVAGGTCSNFAQWLPGRVISESIDPFHMASTDYFEKWGRDTVEKIFSVFDGGIIHIHGNGRHLFEAAATIKGLKAVYLGDDRNYPPAFEIIREAKKKMKDIPFICLADFAAFEQALKKHQLVGGVFYNVTNVPDIDTANRCMELVRNYRV